MESLTELFKIGPGPSSSHTIAPKRALELYLEAFPDTKSLIIELYGSISLTGKGHFTDEILLRTAGDILCSIRFKLDWEYDFPNGLIITNQNDDQWVVYSLGGGSIKILQADFDFQKDVFPETSLVEIYELCLEHEWSLIDYVEHYEPNIKVYIEDIYDSMISSVQRGLLSEGELRGPLKIKRIAKELHDKALSQCTCTAADSFYLYAYAYAVMEENACLGQIVTAPTCGASGVLAAVIYFLNKQKGYSKERLIDAIIIAGVYGNIVKRNATISGAQGGCQAEVGVACAMSAAAIASLYTKQLSLIDYAAEIGMEHHLGLTCDPVGGFVIIPCIERNAVAAKRAFDAAEMGVEIGQIKQNTITFDMVVETMKQTGNMIDVKLKETSLGGLASLFKIDDVSN